MRRHTQRLTQQELTAQAQNTSWPKLNQAVTEYVAAGWKVFGIHTQGGAAVVCISKTFGNVGGLKSAVLYPDGHIEYSMTKRVTWSWDRVQRLAEAERPTKAPAFVIDPTLAAKREEELAVKEKAEKEADAKTRVEFQARMQTVIVPEGFTSELKEESHHYSKRNPLCFTLKTEDTEIKFDQNGSGHTRFKVGETWKTFDRTGVEDSFYHTKMWDGDDRDLNLNALVTEQLARIAQSRKYYKSAVAVPTLPFTVAPDKIEALKNQLTKQGSISFTPSGFGTGYMVTKKPTRGCRYGEERAKAELEKFLGLSPLYVSTMDCD